MKQTPAKGRFDAVTRYQAPKASFLTFPKEEREHADLKNITLDITHSRWDAVWVVYKYLPTCWCLVVVVNNQSCEPEVSLVFTLCYTISHLN